MEISEQELRTMIRDAIARHTGAGASRAAAVGPQPDAAGMHRPHASHTLFVIAGTTDGDCVIEPNRPCDHCGYCKSLGH